jgi:drug/metabolite transporter (DMT)-like permease
MNRALLGVLCCIFSGLAFGIYWIPIRKLEAVGIPDIWAVFAFTAIPALVALPVMVWRRRILLAQPWQFHLCGFLAGLGFALYAGAYLYTEVIHASVLYYLMPVWGFLLARLILGEPITLLRWLSIAIALAGLSSLIPSASGLPLPHNLGDWMALAAGIMWAGVAVLLYKSQSAALDFTLGFLAWSALASGMMGVLVSQSGTVPYPALSAIVGQLPWLLPFAVLFVAPAAFATMYGPTQINPGLAGLLFMIEISVATVTAALLTNEPVGSRELLGVTLIALAGMLEPIQMLTANRQTA